jgi:hypothetical protein
MSRDGRSDWLKAALFVLALVPMSSSVPIRCGANIWLGFALLVPVGVGVTVGVHSPSGRVRITQSYVPLITPPESYPVATNVIVETLRRHGIEMRSVAPP